MKVIHKDLKIEGTIVALIDGGYVVKWDNGEQYPYSYSEAEECVIFPFVDYSQLEQTPERVEIQNIIKEVL